MHTSTKPSCVVLGGGGFIGSRLCHRLVTMGFRVRAFGRSCLYPEEIRGAEWYQGDFADASGLAQAIAGFDLVFHLIYATRPQSANLDMGSDVQKNVLTSLSLLEMCRKLGVTKIIYVSSGGTVYGIPQQVPTSEIAATNPITAYGISKLSVEKYIALYGYLYGLDYRILRVSNPYGPFQTALKNQGVIAALAACATSGESMDIWGDGSVVRDYIYVEDVVDALVTAIDDRSNDRIFNIGGGEGRSVREVVTTIESLSGKRLNINWKPKRSFDVPISVLSIDRARAELGWMPATKFEAGLRSTLEWWRTRRT